MLGGKGDKWEGLSDRYKPPPIPTRSNIKYVEKVVKKRDKEINPFVDS